MSRVIAVGGAGKLRQKMSTRAAVMRATSMRDGAFSSRLMVGWEHRSRPLSGARPTASLNEGIAAQGVAVVGILISAGDREHAEAKHRRQRVDHPLRVAPLPDATRQRLGQAEPAFGPAQQDQPAVGRDQPALEIGGHFLASDGWQIERQKDIFGHGGVALSLLAKDLALTTIF